MHSTFSYSCTDTYGCITECTGNYRIPLQCKFNCYILVLATVLRINKIYCM